MNNNNPEKNRRAYRAAVMHMGKKEFTLLKMQEYGFWPEHLPTPYERQQDETPSDFRKRQALIEEYDALAEEIASLFEEKSRINQELKKLSKELDATWDYEKIRKEVSKQIMAESIERRAAKKKLIKEEKARKSAAWAAYKKEHIVFIGKGYSAGLQHHETNTTKLLSLGLPLIEDDKALSEILGLSYKQLRLLAYHRDVVTTDNYHRYLIPKKNGGERQIAAPKPLLKMAQQKIRTEILEKVAAADQAHGFLKGRSVVTGASAHIKQPALLINMDLENFFPTITFQRVRGLFRSLGYSGYVSSLIAMLCTYCERTPMEIKGMTKYVKTSDRILPQGSPASPMITNIICRSLDSRMAALAGQYGFVYTRYADDMSFSFQYMPEDKTIHKVVYQACAVIKDEGFVVNTNKTRYLKNNNRQIITGVVINNSELGVPRGWIRRMRAAIHNAGKMAAQGNLPTEKARELAGMASWLKSVNPGRYQALINQAMDVAGAAEKPS